MDAHIFWPLDSLTADIADAAFVQADILEGSYTPHRLHQLADICDDDNMPWVTAMLRLAFSEAAALFGRQAVIVAPPETEGGHASAGSTPETEGGKQGWILLPAAGLPFPLWRRERLRAVVTDFVVTYVLLRRLEAVAPDVVAPLSERLDAARVSLRVLARPPARPRRLSPI